MLRLAAILLALFTTTAAFAQDLTVSAAISLKESLTAIGKQYEADTGDKVTFNFGSSGQLMAQIQSGAPVDVFVSAGQSQVDSLKKSGLLADSPARVIARNTLVLIVPKDAKNPPAAFADLAAPSIKHLAIGQPKTVPAGQYAMQTLTALKLADPLKDRLVFGENVRQVLDYVARGEVEAGLVYATDAREAAADVKVIATAPETSHDPIEYPAAVIKDTKHAASAAKFVDYLTTEKAQKILADSGFLPPAK